MLNPIALLKRKYWSWRVRSGIRVVKELDDIMKKAYWPRYKRKQFWREFIKSRQKALLVSKGMKELE